MSVSVTVKFTLSHGVVENCTTSVKNWLYQLLPYVSITGGVFTARRIFEYTWPPTSTSRSSFTFASGP